jgi:glutathione synthase/RimK-type ligase-like ATP-grasp enzyme
MNRAKNRVLLVGPSGDPHLARLSDALDGDGAEAVLVDSREKPWGPRVTFSPTHEVHALGPAELTGVTGAFVRALPPRHPAFSRPPPDVGYSLDDARVAEMEGGALRDAVCAVLELLWGRGFSVLNPPAAGVMEQQKPWQLSVAKRADLKVPRTLVTNDPKCAADFLAELAQDGRGAVAKPVRGNAYTTEIEQEDPRLESLCRAPVILQERIPGADIRAVLLDGRPLSVARIEGTETLDYRSDPTYLTGGARYEKTELPGDVVRSLASVCTGLGLSFVGVDLKLDDDGRWTFLEMNSAPAFLEMEDKTGDAITDALVGRLLGPA